MCAAKSSRPVLVILIHPNADYAGKNVVLSAVIAKIIIILITLDIYPSTSRIYVEVCESFIFPFPHHSYSMIQSTGF